MGTAERCPPSTTLRKLQPLPEGLSAKGGHSMLRLGTTLFSYAAFPFSLKMTQNVFFSVAFSFRFEMCRKHYQRFALSTQHLHTVRTTCGTHHLACRCFGNIILNISHQKCIRKINKRSFEPFCVCTIHQISFAFSIQQVAVCVQHYGGRSLYSAFGRSRFHLS